MSYLAIFKRIVPFLLTFAAGLFIASFFVSIAAPNLNFQRGGGSYKMRDYKRMKIENEELRRENSRMKRELDALKWNTDGTDFEYSVPAPPDFDIDAPPPPPPPRAPRVPRAER